MLCCNMQGRHSLLLSLCVLFYAAPIHAASNDTDPLRFAVQHPEYPSLRGSHLQFLKELAAQPERLHAASVLQKKSKQWATKHQRSNHKDTLAVAFFCLVTDMQSTREFIADCQTLSFDFYQNALYMIQYFLDLLPHSVWDDPNLQTTLNKLHDIQNKAFRLCPFTAAAYTHMNLLKHHRLAPQNLNEFLNPITAHSEGLSIVIDTWGDIKDLCKKTDTYISQIFQSDGESIEVSRCDTYRRYLYEKGFYAEAPGEPKARFPLFLNLGCAPLLGKSFPEVTPLIPCLDYSDFPKYTAHLAALLPHTPEVTFPNICVDAIRTENFPFLRLLLQHSLPLKEANEVCRTLEPLTYEAKHKHTIDQLTHAQGFRIAALFAHFENEPSILTHPKNIWTRCHPSLIQYFGLWLALLERNDYESALRKLCYITKINPELLNEYSSLVSQSSQQSEYSVDRFYAIGPAKWLFLLTQVVGAALLIDLDYDNIMQLSSSVRQAIQDAPWLSTPTASRFKDGAKVSQAWTETVTIIKNLADSHINVINACEKSKQNGFPLADGPSSQATPKEIKALRFWFEIEAMAHKIQQHGHTAVSYQEVADLFAEHGLAFHTQDAPSAQPATLKQICVDTIDGRCTLAQDLGLLIVTNPKKKENLTIRYQKTLTDFQEIRLKLQVLPSEPISLNLKDLFSTLSKKISENCPELKPYIHTRTRCVGCSL